MQRSPKLIAPKNRLCRNTINCWHPPDAHSISPNRTGPSRVSISIKEMGPTSAIGITPFAFGAKPTMRNYRKLRERNTPRPELINCFPSRLKTISFEMSQAAPSGEGLDINCVPHVLTEGGNEDHLSISEAVLTATGAMRASKFCGKSLQDGTISGEVFSWPTDKRRS